MNWEIAYASETELKGKKIRKINVIDFNYDYYMYALKECGIDEFEEMNDDRV